MKFFKNVISQNCLVMDNNNCSQLLLKTFATDSEWNNDSFQELYVFGGRVGWCVDSQNISKYHSPTDQWVELPDMPIRPFCSASAALDQCIYFCGKLSGGNDEFVKFDTNTNEWTQLSPVKHGRSFSSMVALDGYLYIAGGLNESNKSMSYVERYSVENDQWEEVSSMNTTRYGLELVQLNGFLYAIGGRLQHRASGTNIVEKYDPRTDCWELVAPMLFSSSWMSSVAFDGDIYVVGKVTQVYDPIKNEWKVGTSVDDCVEGRRLSVLNEKLYLTGGNDYGDFPEKTVLQLDPEQTKWIPVKDMNIGRSHHGAAVITKRISDDD